MCGHELMVQSTCMATCMTERCMHRYLWSSLRPREAPKATAFDTYLRPGALADPQPKQAPQRRAADFASYLRQPEAGHSQARDSSSFGVFLKKAAPPKPAGLASAAPAAAGTVATPDMCYRLSCKVSLGIVDTPAIFSLKLSVCFVTASGAMHIQVMPRQASCMDLSRTRQW